MAWDASSTVGSKKEIKVNVEPLLWVTDIDSSVRFYQRLGFSIEDSWKPDGKIRWCRLVFSRAAIMLQQGEGDESRRSIQSPSREIELYFVCDDVDELYDRFIREGVVVSKPTIAFYGMKQIFLDDPDGRELCFECPAGN